MVVRFLCVTFGGGIAGVSVGDGGFIVMVAELTGDSPVDASIAVGPDGTCAARIRVGHTHIACTTPDARSFETIVEERLEAIGASPKDPKP